MVKTIIMIVAAIVIVTIFVEAFVELIVHSADEYDNYCHNCQSGFCTEEPRSEECEKIRESIQRRRNIWLD